MSDIGWFPSTRFAIGTQFGFQTPVPASWIISEKISQHNRQYAHIALTTPDFDDSTAEDFDDSTAEGFGHSAAEATFLVKERSSGQIAYMRVYVQIPSTGTEFESPQDRARQAAEITESEPAALKDFHQHHARMIPALLGIREEVQDDDGFVPGGFITYLVFEQVHGIRLADDRILPGWRPFLHTFFERFERPERDRIRDTFSKEYLDLVRTGWLPSFVWADRLIWDPDSGKLWFIDFRDMRLASWRDGGSSLDAKDPRDISDDGPMHEIWESWGLVIPHKNPDDPHDTSRWQF